MKISIVRGIFRHMAAKKVAREKLAASFRRLALSLVPVFALALTNQRWADALFMAFLHVFLHAIAFVVEPASQRRQCRRARLQKSSITQSKWSRKLRVAVARLV